MATIEIRWGMTMIEALQKGKWILETSQRKLSKGPIKTNVGRLSHGIENRRGCITIEVHGRKEGDVLCTCSCLMSTLGSTPLLL